MKVNGAFLKKKELGLPIWAWVIISAVVLLILYRRHKAAQQSLTNPSTSSTSTTPDTTGAGGGGDGGSPDNSQALQNLADEIATETSAITSLLDSLQGKKHKKHKPKHHHPKQRKAPTHRKTPVTQHHGRGNRVIRARRPHKRGSVSAGGGVARRLLGTERSFHHRSVKLGRRHDPHKSLMGRIPANVEPMNAHPPHRPNVDISPHQLHSAEPDRSYTKAPATSRKSRPAPVIHEPERVVTHHPSTTKPHKKGKR